MLLTPPAVGWVLGNAPTGAPEDDNFGDAPRSGRCGFGVCQYNQLEKNRTWIYSWVIVRQEFQGYSRNLGQEFVQAGSTRSHRDIVIMSDPNASIVVPRRRY